MSRRPAAPRGGDSDENAQLSGSGLDPDGGDRRARLRPPPPQGHAADVTVAPENVSKPPASVMPSSERYKQ
jgi:hypothetical protein